MSPKVDIRWPDGAEAPVIVRPVIVRLADVQPEDVAWVWPGRIAIGKVTLIVGDPGLGKSWITLDAAARISTGRPWPDGAVGCRPSSVLLLSAEDGLADTIRPRLDTLGADVTRVHHVAVLRAGPDQERAIQLTDVVALEDAITETGARLVTIDPISAYLGSTDSHRDAEVRGLMAPLAALAERTSVAIVGVMHLSKGANRPAIYRAVGSIAFAAAARIVLAVAADPERAERRIFAPIKSNLSAPPAPLAYTLADGQLVWDTAPVRDVDVDALLSGPPTPRERDEQTDAEHVIEELLEDERAWPLHAKVAIEAGAAHGVNERTMRRTAQRLGIRIARMGFGSGGRWMWHQPHAIADTTADIPPRTEHVSAMAAMRNQPVIADTTHIEDTKKMPSRAREGAPAVTPPAEKPFVFDNDPFGRRNGGVQ